MAVIVNDMSDVNIDADLVRGGEAALSRSEEALGEMTNGCICCTLRDDLLAGVRALAEAGRPARAGRRRALRRQTRRQGPMLRHGAGRHPAVDRGIVRPAFRMLPRRHCNRLSDNNVTETKPTPA